MPVAWRLLDSGPDHGVANMAVDIGLMDRARTTGETVFRVYAWKQATVSFGRHESTRTRFDPADLEAAKLAVVRRPTGGRVLLHHREVTYSVTAPASDPAPQHESYRAINALLIRALARLGVPASEAEQQTRSVAATCFAQPSRGELTVDGRKLVGSAQLTERGALLQHGSILLEDDQGDLARASVGRVPAPPAAATLAACLGRVPTYDEVRDALFNAVLDEAPRASPLAAGEVSPFAQPHRAGFESVEWTWRR